MIKAIIFDLDDTLYSYSKLNEQGINEICKYTCQKLKIEKEEFYEAFNEAKKDVKTTSEASVETKNEPSKKEIS